MTELTLDGVTKHFQDDDGTVVAVDDVSIDIGDGEFLVLVGPSGCGKSTTLRMIAGLESITDGEIRLGDRVINDLQPKDRDIAMVFQSYALYPHMTVRGNMSFGLEEATDMPDDEIRSRVEEAAAMMGIEPLLDRKPGDLSGGQRQRVALGRAIVRDPSVFLMDEPLSNLDAKLRAEMRTELQRIQSDLDVTTVYVTHDQTEAMTMGDRIAILNDGRLQQVATPLDAYHKPNNQFVAGFIGDPSMNFFDTRLEGDRLVADQFEYALPDDMREAVEGHGDVTLGIRPEDVDVLDAGEGDHYYQTTVDVVEPTGSEYNVYLEFGGETAEVGSGDAASRAEDEVGLETGATSDTEAETFVATMGGLQSIAAGDRVVAHLPATAVHLFDGESGAALWNRSLDDLSAEQPPL